MKFIKQLVKPLFVIIGKYFPIFNTKLIFALKRHSLLNLKNPQNFSEKICYLKIYNYNSNSLVKKCADKYRVREYIKEKGLKKYLSQIYDVYNSVAEISSAWDKLPNEFVLKWNFWYGLNIICNNKNMYDVNEVINKLSKFEKCEDFYATSELQYEVSKKVLICEKYISNLINYKFYYFNGVCKAILVTKDGKDGKKFGSMYIPDDWSIQTKCNNFRYDGELDVRRPNTFDTMLKIGNVLASDFPFVRIDMYEDKNRPVIGEMTFTPGAGITPTEIIINDKEMGDILKI